jgi:hypothetical protein
MIVLVAQGSAFGQATAEVNDHEPQARPALAPVAFDELAVGDSWDLMSCVPATPLGCYPPTPNMLGDFFHGYSAGIRGAWELDRLFLIADDLDSPSVLPPSHAQLTITESGPVGIFQSSIVSVQQLQQLLRAGGSLPPASLVGTVPNDATMTTALTVGQIQDLLASTPGVGYDVVPLAAPPGSYGAAVHLVFQDRVGAGGITTYDAAASGAMLQGGLDTLEGGEDFDAFYYYAYLAAIDVTTPGPGIGPLGRIKVADGNSPLPRDRAYFHYGFFDAVPMTRNGTSLNRFVPGFERALLDGLVSWEMRFPFAATTDSDMAMGTIGMTNTSSVEFGNLAAYFKALLYTTDRLSVSGGLGVTVPTARDLRVRWLDGQDLVRIDNEAVHLHPFAAALYTPNDRWFAQGFFQLDVASSGNLVAVNSGSGLTEAGRINDSTFLFADVGLGYWLRRCPTGRLTGVAPTVELHYNKSLQAADYVTAGPLTVGNFGRNVEALNLTIGSTFTLGHTTNLAVGYVTPLGGGPDRQLDGSVRVLLDYIPHRRF